MDFSKFECLSFDCYGTLIDWETGLARALRHVTEAHAADVDDETLLGHYGRAEAAVEAAGFCAYREVLKRSLRAIGDELDFQPSDDECEAFAASIQDWPAFADSSVALKQLATRYRLIILSNVDDDLFAASQARLGVTFDHVFTAQQIGSYKPSPRNFQYLLDHAGVPRDRILHVAQSVYHDIGPAKALGLATVWINRRQGQAGTGATPPADAEPDFVAPDLQSFAATALGSGD